VQCGGDVHTYEQAIDPKNLQMLLSRGDSQFWSLVARELREPDNLAPTSPFYAAHWRLLLEQEAGLSGDYRLHCDARHLRGILKWASVSQMASVRASLLTASQLAALRV
jgi:hypothetical protein